MENITIEQVNKNVLELKIELDEIKRLIQESNLEIAEEAKSQIKESRKRPVSEFKSQKEMEKKFS